MPLRPRSDANWKRLGLTFGLLASFLLAADSALFIQNRTLKKRIQTLSISLLPPVGFAMPPLVGVGEGGASVSLTYSKPARKTLLFVFSPVCEVCLQNWNNWLTIQRVAAERVRVVYVNPVGPIPANWLARHGASGVPFIAQVSPDSLVAYNLRYTPETILVDETGKILRAWEGLLDHADIRQIERLTQES